MARRHALIVGGTKGIGRATARRFAADGWAVSVVGRSVPAEADRLGPDVRYFSLDLSDRERLPAALGEIVAAGGRLNALVFLQRWRGTGDDWAGEIAVTLTATKSLIEAARDRFAADGPRSIVMVSSVASDLIADKQPASYHVGKAGLNQLVRYYAVALGPLGIRVNGVSPCTILKDESRHFYLQNEKLHGFYKSIIPLGRMGSADEVAGVIAFLCGPDASFVNGQDLVVDGGMTLQLHDAFGRRLADVA